MQIQSLSVVVPGKRCVNNCPFCVSRMHPAPFKNQIEENTRFIDLYEKDYIKRMQFARDNGCNTIILTGDVEPLQNERFLRNFSHWNQMLRSPFQWIELQTTGIFINDEKLRFLRNTVGVTNISISVSDLFDDNNNMDIIGVPTRSRFKLGEICGEIKRYDFTLRLSINLIARYLQSYDTIDRIFERAKELGADQITFRKMYASGKDSDIDKWISERALDPYVIDKYEYYIKENGRALEKLPFGATRYSADGFSVVIDGDCMNTEAKDTLKYLILRPDCKLYSHWDDPASLIF